MIRITGGVAGGRVIKVPAGKVRPATARIRRSLFDYLSGVVFGSRVIDLYCGSGGLGFEALSRGAEAAVFVDQSREVTHVCRENAVMLGFENRCEFVTGDVFTFISSRRVQMGEERSWYDIVFAAPPYQSADPQRILDALAGSTLIAFGSSVCLEYSKHTPAPVVDEFFLDRHRKYGETVIEVWDRL